MTDYPKRRGIDWVAVSIGCATMVLLVAVLLGLVLVYTVVSSQPDTYVEVTPLAAIEVADIDEFATESVTADVASAPTIDNASFVLEVVTATPTQAPTPTLLPTPTASAPTAIPPTPQRDVRGDIPPAIVQSPINEIERENLARMWHMTLPPPPPGL